MKETTIDYNQDIQELMIRFYGALAKIYLIILCFKPQADYRLICETPSTNGTADNAVYKPTI